MSTSFNLIDEAWIPCLTTENTNELLSLRQLFTSPRAIQRLASESPIENYTILRILLVIFWRAHREDKYLSGTNKRFDRWWETQFERFGVEPDAACLDYLESNRERFDLFGPQPFMQVPELNTASGKQSEFRRLFPESESDQFSLRAGEQLTVITPAEAARAIIRIQATDYSGIKTGAVGDPRVKGGKGYPIGTGWTGMTGGTVIHGHTLAETLVLNTDPQFVFSTGMEADLPCWERPIDSAAEREFPTPTGPCDLLTWQARRVRLFTDADAITGVTIANGDQIPDAGANIHGDPMTPMRYSQNQSKKRGIDVRYPMPYPSTRTLWRSLDALLVREGVVPSETKPGEEPNAPATIRYLGELPDPEELFGEFIVTVELISLEYGAQSSSITNLTNLVFDVPLSGLDAANPATAHVITTMASHTREAAKHIGVFGGQLLEAAGGDYAFDTGIADSYLDQLQPEFLDWMRRFDRADVREHRMKWNDTARRVALELAYAALRSAGPRALIGRVIKSEDSERVLTAGSAYLSLTARINKIFPIAGNLQQK